MKQTNLLLLTVFVLSLSITTSAEEEPSREETIAWLHEKISGIELRVSDPDIDESDYTNYAYELYFPEDGTVVKIVRSEHYMVQKRKHALRDILNAKLSDLSVQVNREQAPILRSEYVSLVLSCSSAQCFSGDRESTVSELEGPLSSPQAKFAVPITIADRVQKAFSHLISLSGGTEKVSEDLF